MPTYKLTYFNGRGRGELIRFVFAQAGVEYDDVRITGEEFGKLKPTLPTGMLPVLDVDETKLSGSGPIAWYLAEEFGLAGSNNLDKAKIGGILDVLGDLLGKMIPARFGDCEETKLKAKKDLEEKFFPKYLGVLQKLITDNKSPDGWAFGNSVTIADLSMCVLLDEILEKAPPLGDSFPAVKKNVDAVKALPKIAAWLKKRPETPF